MQKAKKYDWKDSNLSMFGSDEERQVKKESAETEPAWQGAGQEVGLKVWRIVQFEVKDWPEADYGKFFSGDSYIILNTYHPSEDSEALAYDVHFWIGSKSSQDEYGTAAYKTVELDTFLDDNAIQHREVQGRESALFRSYFKNIIHPLGGLNSMDEYGTAAYKTVELDTFLDDLPVQHREVEGHESVLFRSYFKEIIIMEGGAESGFNHVTPEEYQPRLLHFSGARKHITVKEVPLNPARLNSGDVFILDLGTTIYQWNGSGSNKDERFKAAQFLNNMKSERGAVEAEVLEEEDVPESHPIMQALTGDDEEDEDEGDSGGEKQLFKVSDESGEVQMTLVKEGDITQDDFAADDVFILDANGEVFVWIGSGASTKEKKNGLSYANTHLQKSSHPLVPISVIKEGQKSGAFDAAIAA